VTIAESPAQSSSKVPEVSGANRRISYEPGLDGLRALSVLATFLVHANVGAPGGFLGVSSFFTLSGFLITAVLVSEHRSRGRIALGMFWQRRARRLMPAALMTIVLAGLATLWLGDATQVHELFGDVVGTLAYVANWRFILAGTNYAAEFSGQSPLLHFWSLAIEEQFYIVYPLVMVGALAVSARWRWSVPAVLLLGIVASVCAGISASGSAETINELYFRTDIRAGELLVGALFGYWWASGGRNMGEAAHRVVRWVGAVLLAVMMVLIVKADHHDLYWYQGGLPAYSLVTVGVVLAAVEPRGLVRRVLGWRPLVWIGVVSYGAYLAHWPLFMWLQTDTDLSGPMRLLVGTTATLALAYLSYRVVELPVRERRRFSVRSLILLGTLLVAAALVIGKVAPKVARTDEAPLAQTEQEVLMQMLETMGDQIIFTAAAKGEAPTVGIYGDSTAAILARGMSKFDDTDKTIRTGSGWTRLGCTVSTPTEYISLGNKVNVAKVCPTWLQEWRKKAMRERYDVALVQFGCLEVKTMQPMGVDHFQTIGEPAQDALLEQRFTEGLESLLAATPIVVVATSPYVEYGRRKGHSPDEPQPENDPVRMDRVNEIIRSVAERYPNVAIMDLAGWIAAQGEDDRRLRPDGAHFAELVALELSPRYAATLRSIIDVANGAEPPVDTTNLFPVLKYAKVAGVNGRIEADATQPESP